MNKTPKTPAARALALSSLEKIEREGKYSNLEIDSTIQKNKLSPEDKALYTRLVYGVTERRLTLDGIISQYSKIPVTGLDSDVKNALRLGIYQLLYTDRIPDHSAVDESVSLVAKAKSGYVNAVLRSFIRAGKTYTLPTDEDERLEFEYSVPRDICKIYKQACDGNADECALLLTALNREAQVGIRLNRLKADESALPEGGTDAGNDVYLYPSLTPELRCGIDGGLWFVQDISSRITTKALEAKPGEVIADVCACPGGKSFSIAVDMGNRGTVYSFDLHKNKLSLLEKGAAKLGIDIIITAPRDARVPDPDLIGRCDRVLCDAPCSGLGVIAKKPEIRYKNIADITKLPQIQREILAGASRYVKPGGVLIYSTCTLNPAENGEVVKAFLDSNPDFTLEGNKYIPDGERTFMPHRDGCDGFFAARMIRK